MQSFLRKCFIGLILLLVAGVLTVLYLVLGIHRSTPGYEYNQGRNAIWLQHSWLETPYSGPTLEALGQSLVDHEMMHVYVHAGPFNPDGGVDESTLLHTESFLRTMKTQFPRLRFYAWLGQLRAKIDLEDPAVRAEMVRIAETMVERGFEGIHMNIEPLRPDDTAFLDLLREIRLTLPNTYLSVAVDEWQPEMLSNWLANKLQTEIVSYVSSRQFNDIMPLVDQVVVMGYDTSLKTAEWYRWFLEQQVIYVTQLGHQNNTDVLIGLPVYEQGQEGAFDPEVENIESGILGVIHGLQNLRSKKSAFEGVALYPHWEISEAEWDIYEKLWQNEGS